ncbi:kinase-like protein [Rhizoctonia solani]|nr:kinase-like protein [Rhizoctonia solani]
MELILLQHAAHELYIWSKCSHPNILELSGVMIFRERIAMVSPWVENNHLRWFLARGLQVDRCALCVQIVDGVDYLHGQGIVHGDLKPENILISEDHTPKLTDFGNAALAEYTLNFTNTSAAQSISARWTAPEILKQESKTTRAGDIFALGMIIFEAMTGLLPYAGSSDPVVMFSIAAGKLPDRPQAHIPIGVEQADRLWSVLTSCWAHDPNERPKAQKVRNMIEEITPGGLLNEADSPGC